MVKKMVTYLLFNCRSEKLPASSVASTKSSDKKAVSSRLSINLMPANHSLKISKTNSSSSKKPMVSHTMTKAETMTQAEKSMKSAKKLSDLILGDKESKISSMTTTASFLKVDEVSSSEPRPSGSGYVKVN